MNTFELQFTESPDQHVTFEIWMHSHTITPVINTYRKCMDIQPPLKDGDIESKFGDYLRKHLEFADNDDLFGALEGESFGDILADMFNECLHEELDCDGISFHIDTEDYDWEDDGAGQIERVTFWIGL